MWVIFVHWIRIRIANPDLQHWSQDTERPRHAMTHSLDAPSTRISNTDRSSYTTFNHKNWRVNAVKKRYAGVPLSGWYYYTCAEGWPAWARNWRLWPSSWWRPAWSRPSSPPPPPPLWRAPSAAGSSLEGLLNKWLCLTGHAFSSVGCHQISLWAVQPLWCFLKKMIGIHGNIDVNSYSMTLLYNTFLKILSRFLWIGLYSFKKVLTWP